MGLLGILPGWSVLMLMIVFLMLLGSVALLGRRLAEELQTNQVSRVDGGLSGGVAACRQPLTTASAGYGCTGGAAPAAGGLCRARRGRGRCGRGRHREVRGAAAAAASTGSAS